MEFFFFYYFQLKNNFNNEDHIRYYIIKEIVENSNYDFLEKIFLQFHFIKHDILVYKDKLSILFDKNTFKLDNTSFLNKFGQIE